MKQLLRLTALVLLLAGTAQATAMTGWRATTTLTWGTDSSNYVDSCIGYYAGQFFGGDVDSMRRITTAVAKFDATVTKRSNFSDSLTRYAFPTIASFGDIAVNPSIVFFWYLNDGQVIRDNAPQIVMKTWMVDSVSESTTAASDTINIKAALTAAHGAGNWTSGGAGAGPDLDSIYIQTADSTAIVGAQVTLTPNDGGTNLYATSDAQGWAIFSVTAPDTFLAYTYNSGYYQTTVPSQNIVLAAVRDTVTLALSTSLVTATPGLTPIQFAFYGGEGTALLNVEVTYRLKSQIFPVTHADSTRTFDAGREFSVRSNASGIATINVVSNDSLVAGKDRQTGETSWIIQAFNATTDKQIMDIELKVPASDTALVWPRDRAVFDQ